MADTSLQFSGDVNNPFGTGSPYVAPTTTSTQPSGPSFANSQPTSPVVTSSNSAQNFVDNTGNNIATAASNPPVIPGTSNPTGAAPIPYDPSADPSVQADITNTNQVIQTQRDSLKARQDAEIAQLTSQETTDKADLEQSQKNETGTSSRNLAYLQQGGNSASAQAYLNSLEITHGKEMDTLVAKYNSAIQAARNAYADKDFDLAQQMVANAKDIKNQAATRNQQFLDYTLKLRTQANDEAKFNAQNQKDARDFAIKYGVKSQFYTLDGQTIIDSHTGNILTSEQYQQMGGKGDGTDIQVVDSSGKDAPGVIGEWNAYNDQVAKSGVKPVSLQQFVTMTHPASVTNIYGTGAFSTGEINSVQSIIDAKPGDGGWGDAVKAIDSKLGAGTAARYDNLLKVSFQLPDDARSAAKSMPSSVTLAQWNTARQQFIQDHAYADPDAAGKEFDKTVPKPGAKSSIDLNSTIQSAVGGQ